MNANELADWLETIEGYPAIQAWGNKLRQQQAEIAELIHMNRNWQISEGMALAEIEALKLQLHTTLINRDLRTYDGKLDMNNEPVAWKVIETDNEGSFTTFTEVEPVWTDNAIPLYTHPAKTLTDEEVLEIYHDVYVKHHNDGIDFARAILRKAQEK